MKSLAVFIGLCAALCYTAAARELVVGAPAAVSEQSEDVKEAAQFAVSTISQGYGGDNQLGLLRVVSATRQVVAGSLYTLKLVAGGTDCPKASPKPVCSIPSEAQGSDHPDYNECTVKVWDQSWLNPRYKITQLKCNKPNANEVA